VCSSSLLIRRHQRARCQAETPLIDLFKFAEPALRTATSGSRSTRPCFAGIWTNWTSVRKVKEGETTDDLYAFLATEPNAEVGAIHPKAMPVILTTLDEVAILRRMRQPSCSSN